MTVQPSITHAAPVAFLDRRQAGHERFHPRLPSILDVQVELIEHVATETGLDVAQAAQQLTQLALARIEASR